MSLSISEHITLWAISVFFVSTYFMYDRYKVFKAIGDALLYISWRKRKIDILSFALPGLGLSIFSIIYDCSK